MTYDNRAESIEYYSAATISVYDEGGQRVQKVTPSSTTTYVGDIYECNESDCSVYIFAGSERIAKINASDTIYYHTDHLGSSSIMTDQTGTSVEDIFYYPYGDIKTNTGSENVSHKFTGQEYEAEYGLYYYGARYYDPKLARFISADTFVQNFSDPQSLNRYSYTRNNPVIYTDPSGHWFWTAVAIGAVMGGSSAAVQGGDLGDILQGMIIGGMSAGVGYGAGLAASSFVSASSVTVTSVVAGAAGGTAAGATSAALTGGNIGQGALIGMFAGGIGGYIGTINLNNPYLEGLVQIGSGGLVGGAASELTGGKFSEGFGLGAISGAVAFATNRILEGKRFQSPIEQQKEKLLRYIQKRLEELNVDVAWLIRNPTQSKPLGDGGVFDTINNEIYQSFGSEIDYIRSTGSCATCPQLRFRNFHIKLDGGTTYIHYDRVDPVFSPTLHGIRDYWLNR